MTADEDAFPPDELPPEEPGAMSFLEHLEELRWVLVKSAVTFGVGCTLVGVFLANFAELLRWPYEFAVAGREMTMVGEDGFINTGFLGVFSVIFQLMFIGGLGLSLPVILFFIAQFVAPGLTKEELRVLRPACMGSLALFLMGAGFSFFILLPAGLRASIIFNDLLGFELLITATSYYGLLTWSVLGVGVAFQFPLVLLILLHIGVITVDQLRSGRRFAIVGFLVLSAVVTPTPDPVTFLFLALPLWALYEVAIVLGARFEKRRDAASGRPA